MRTKPSRRWIKGLRKWTGAVVILCTLIGAGSAEAKEVGRGPSVGPGLDLPSVVSAARAQGANKKHPAQGILNSVFGTINNGLVVWTPEEREPSRRRLYIKPLLLTDASGQLTPGVGLKLIDW